VFAVSASSTPNSQNFRRDLTPAATALSQSRFPSSAAMLARSVTRCSNKLRVPVSWPYLRLARPQCRRFSMHATGPTPGSAPMSSAGMLAPFTAELDRIAPSFKINGSQIRVLQSPAEFYETLKDKIRNAERRIFLSTLYIGKSERELVRDGRHLRWAYCVLTSLDRHAARDPPREARTETQHPYRRPTRNTRGSGVVMRIPAGALDRRVWSRASRDPHVPHA
jgi:hypothetical protein